MVQIIQKHRWLSITGLIAIIALVVRLLGNTHVPPAPYWEEVALGYDAYSILKTGKDHHGNTFPIVAFASFGDFKPSLYFYSLVPSIATFGLTPFAVRLPAALASTGTVVLAMFFARKFTQSNALAWWAGLLLAMQPWSLLIGRVGFEVNLATFLLLLGTLSLWQAMEVVDKKPAKTYWFFATVAAITLALSMYTYHGMRLLAPLFALATVGTQIAWWKPQHFPMEKWRRLVGTAGLALICILPILIAIRTPEVQQRIQETSLFTLSEPVNRSNHYRELAQNSLFSKVLYHRYIFWAELISTNYLKHLSPQFLFVQGDINPRHASQYFGMLYPWEIVTIVLGLIGLHQWWKNKSSRYFLLLLLLSPVAAALTQATPHALRALPLSFFLALLSATGIMTAQHTLSQWGKKYLPKKYVPNQTPIIILMFGGILLTSFMVLAHYMWFIYAYRYSHEWQYGYQAAIESLTEHKQDNEMLYLSRNAGRPAMYVLFYQRWNPREVQAINDELKQDQQEFLELPGWKFYDGVSTEPGLHAAPEPLVPPQAQEIDRVLRLDGSTAWVIYRIQ